MYTSKSKESNDDLSKLQNHYRNRPRFPFPFSLLEGENVSENYGDKEVIDVTNKFEGTEKSYMDSMNSNVSNNMRAKTYMTPGYAYVPDQTANQFNLYSPEMGLKQGTLFPELDKPMSVYGMEGK